MSATKFVSYSGSGLAGSGSRSVGTGQGLTLRPSDNVRKATVRSSRGLQVCFVASVAREAAAPANRSKHSLPLSRSFAYEAGSSAGAHVSGSWLGNRSQLAPEEQVQQNLQQQAAGLGLPEVPSGLEGIIDAYITASRTLAAASNLVQAGYQWVHACLVVMAWEKALAAEQQLAAEQAVWETYSAKVATKQHHNHNIVQLRLNETMARAVAHRGTLPLFDAFSDAAYEAAAHVPQRCDINAAQAGLSKAQLHLKSAADSFAWQLLNVLNDNNCQPGLALDSLPVPLQRFTYSLLRHCGCATAWGLAIYRQLPATVAAIRPGVVAAVGLQQYLTMLQHTPSISMDQMDGTWGGQAQVRVHEFQVITNAELAKALQRPDALSQLFRCHSGFAADLAAAAAELGIIDSCTAAAAAASSSSRSLAELLLMKFTKAVVGLSAAAVFCMCKVVPVERCTIAAAAEAVVAGCNADAPAACSGCSGGGIRRGSLTAVGAGDCDDSAAAAAGASIVPLSRVAGRGRQGLLRRVVAGVGRVFGSRV